MRKFVFLLYPKDILNCYNRVHRLFYEKCSGKEELVKRTAALELLKNKIAEEIVVFEHDPDIKMIFEGQTEFEQAQAKFRLMDLERLMNYEFDRNLAQLYEILAEMVKSEHKEIQECGSFELSSAF